MSILFYRRPDYTAQPRGPLNAADCAKYVERARSSGRAIPPGLSFEEIISNNTLPPCSLNDFMDYLVYVELNAENLQFYLWYQDYVRRFNVLPENEKALSPEWKPEPKDIAPVLSKEKDPKIAKKPSISAPIHNYWDGSDMGYSFDIGSPGIKSDVKSEVKADIQTDTSSTIASTAEDSFAPSSRTNEFQTPAGFKWQPFSIQPFREEVNRALRHYLAFSSPRELNLSHKDRALVLHALQHTTHPSALLPAITVAEATLRGQSHPNFIRWAICNGSKPRVFLIKQTAYLGLLLAFVLAIVLTLSKQSRWWRLFSGILFFVGITTLVAAYKGICIILHHWHSHNLRPWEIDDDIEAEQRPSADSTVSGSRIFQLNALGGNEPSKSFSFDDFGDSKTLRPSFTRTTTNHSHSPSQSQSHSHSHSHGNSQNHAPTLTTLTTLTNNHSITIQKSHQIPSRWLAPFGPKNTWEHEPWVARYKKRPYLRKAFERQTWTQNETLQLLQDRIVLGSYAWGFILTVPVMVLFVAVPGGGYF